MPKKLGICFALALLLLIRTDAQDQNAKSTAAQNSAVPTAPETAHAPATQDPNYIIGAQDVLDISVWKEAELTRTVPVRPDGKISMPLLNDVQAAGLTPTQLAQSITEKLKKYIAEPQVTV